MSWWSKNQYKNFDFYLTKRPVLHLTLLVKLLVFLYLVRFFNFVRYMNPFLKKYYDFLLWFFTMIFSSLRKCSLIPLQTARYEKGTEMVRKGTDHFRTHLVLLCTFRIPSVLFVMYQHPTGFYPVTRSHWILPRPHNSMISSTKMKQCFSWSNRWSFSFMCRSKFIF